MPQGQIDRQTRQHKDNRTGKQEEGANNSGTTTIRNAAVTFSNASTFDALSATAGFDTVNVGGGYGSTGVTLSSAGNIQANGNLTIDGTSQLTGAVTASNGITVSGTTTADIISSKTTANLFNTTATTLNVGGAAISLPFSMY